MSEPLVLADLHDGLARLTLNRPQKRNALTRELLTVLHARLVEIAGRPDVRCLVLAARGPAFCAGMDVAQMQETAARPDAANIWHADSQLYHDVVATLYGLPFPTLAVVQGAALAGGLGLILACDLVVAADAATFALPEPMRGITAAIVTPLLLHRAGPAAASYMLLAGAGVDARQAQQMGICQTIVEAARLEAAADERVGAIFSGAPGALAITKQQLRACSTPDVLKQLAEAVAVSASARETAEAREGLAAFLEKRPAAWQSRHPKSRP